MPTRRNVRRSGPRRKLVWMRSLGTTTALTSATTPSVFDLSSVFQIVSGQSFMPIGSTVVRTRIDIGWARTAGVSVTPRLEIGLILGLNTLDAADIDPSVSTSLHLDWMLWQALYHESTNAAQVQRQTFDVQAMRKAEELQSTLWLSFGNSGSDTYEVDFGASVLLMLP